MKLSVEQSPAGWAGGCRTCAVAKGPRMTHQPICFRRLPTSTWSEAMRQIAAFGQLMNMLERSANFL